MENCHIDLDFVFENSFISIYDICICIVCNKFYIIWM